MVIMGGKKHPKRRIVLQDQYTAADDKVNKENKSGGAGQDGMWDGKCEGERKKKRTQLQIKVVWQVYNQ